MWKNSAQRCGRQVPLRARLDSANRALLITSIKKARKL
jgi:hypothetical protein